MSGGASGTADAGIGADAGTLPECGAGVASASIELCNGLDDDCDGDVDEEAACAAACRGFAIEGRGYMFCNDAVDRDASLARCAAVQMTLSHLESADENSALVLAITQLGLPLSDDELLVHIGASDSDAEQQWYWVGSDAFPDDVQFWSGGAAGEAVGGAHANWADGEPNDNEGDEDCAVISVLGSDSRAPGQWDDRSCASQLPFVCEVP